MKIGFFDSGIGGLTVLKQAIERYPNAHYLYFADTDNVPYGTKTQKAIKALVADAIDFLVRQKQVDVLVLACNTATSVSIKRLRKTYDLPIIGMEPAIKPAALATRNKTQQQRILICATKLTLRQKKLKGLINDLNINDKIDLLSLQKLVRYAEQAKFNSKSVRQYLHKKFDQINWQDYGAIVLGCTHFIYYKTIIKELIPAHVEIIDGNAGTVSRMITLANQLAPISPRQTKITFYKSKKKSSRKEALRLMEQCP